MINYPGKSVIDDFIKEARGQTLLAVWERLGRPGVKLRHVTGLERACACPVHGGNNGDEFAMNLGKQVFLCRKAGDGGDALAMAAHLMQVDLKSAGRSEFLRVCAGALGRDAPDPAAIESEAQRQERERAAAERLAAQEKEALERQKEADAWRERARRTAREKWERAGQAGQEVRAYLALRAGFSPSPFPAALRFSPHEAFCEDLDEDGKAEQLWSGPALIAPFVGADMAVIGCHRTWIDPNIARVSPGGKGRPQFWILTKAGREAGAAAPPLPGPRPAGALAGHHAPLATKKMLGTKKGGFIPVCGKSRGVRWVAAEGIENAARVAAAENYRADTFYCAAGDLGNLAGRADPDSAFSHPELKRLDKNGVLRPVRVPGPVPLDGDDCMPVFDHVDTLILIADGDSERVMTEAAMARAKARHAKPGRVVAIVWPPAGGDISDVPQVSE